MFAFDDKFNILGFERTAERLKPIIKHQNKVKNWATLTNLKKLDVFLWLTTFLPIFILG